MTKEEQETFDLHTSKPSFGRYGDMELSTVLKMLLFKISVITGWKLPDDDFYMTVLTDQLTKKIKEDYKGLNESEVEYAFRKYGTTVKDWGKVFNLSLLDQVLIPYCNYKSDILDFVSRLPINERQIGYTQKPDWKLVIEENYQQFLTEKYNIELWPWEIYDEFVHEQMMAFDAYEGWLKPALYRLLAKMTENNDQRERWIDIKAKQFNHPAVSELAKRMAVELLFKEAKHRGFKNLFYEKI